MTSLPSGLPEHVADGEPLARFLLTKRYFSTANERVKAEAFLPPPNLELSVFRICHLDDSAIEALGQPVAAIQSKKLCGWGRVMTAAVRRLNLDLEADEEPKRHANIVGWPTEPDRDVQKGLHKRIALELANEATLVLAPGS